MYGVHGVYGVQGVYGVRCTVYCVRCKVQVLSVSVSSPVAVCLCTSVILSRAREFSEDTVSDCGRARSRRRLLLCALKTLRVGRGGREEGGGGGAVWVNGGTLEQTRLRHTLTGLRV